MKLIYDVADKPKFSKTLVFAFQQMIAIMAATLLVPMLVSGYGLEADVAAALFGAGIGTIVYLLFTKRRSPVFLGSSFTFLGAYAASIGQNYGYWGIIIGVTFAGLVYVVIALFVRLIGSGWVNKLMPPAIIGPIVALIGLSLSGTATSWIMGNGAAEVVYTETYNWVSIICALFTFFMIVVASVKGSKRVKLIPFIIGISAGYALALIFTLIGMACGNTYLQVLSFQPFIDTFSDVHLLLFMALAVVVGAAYGLLTLFRRNAMIVHFRDIDSLYPTVLALLVAAAATLYATIQLFEPESWRHFYYHPSLNPFALPPHLGAFLSLVWAIVIVGIAAVEEIARQLSLADTLLYLCGLAAVCAIDYVVFSISTLYYIGYPLFVVYAIFALKRYYQNTHCRYICGNCGAKMLEKGVCRHCGALNE